MSLRRRNKEESLVTPAYLHKEQRKGKRDRPFSLSLSYQGKSLTESVSSVSLSC